MDYNSFDFANDQKFQTYLQNIYPIPSNMDKLKRKWYRNNIDPNFVIENDQKQEQPQTEQEEKQLPTEEQKQQQQQQEQQQQQQPQPQPQSLPTLYVVEGILKVLYLPLFLCTFLPEYVKYINIWCVVISIMGLYRMTGRIQFNQAYVQKIMPNEFTANLFYTAVLFSGGSPVFHLPIALHFLSGASEFWCRLSTEQGFILKAAQYFRNNRNILIVTKAKIEIYLFFYALFGMIFVKHMNFFTAMLLFQNMALKSKINPNMMNAQAYLRVQYAETLSENKKLPQFVRVAFTFIWKAYEKLIHIL